jgi:hypothetical protein
MRRNEIKKIRDEIKRDEIKREEMITLPGVT